ncbi:hypothetical protein BC826DRAFT_904156 [Russula brevipes]|nr:hypothetical protein BC826DRAFT_904156 [Russula brevipes]
MKITIKTLQQKVFNVESDPADTISNLKEKIQEQQGHPVESQKIIYSGKVLSDDKTVESCNIKEKDFLVLMVSKPKLAPAASTSTASPVSAPPVTPAAATPAPAPASESPAPAPVSTAPPASNPLAEAPPLGTSFLSGEALQTTIRNMEEMGFPKDQVLRALRASYNNPDRAVEYLFSGIPAHLEPELGASASRTANPPANSPSSNPVATSPSTVPPTAPQSSEPQNLFQLAQQQQRQQQSPRTAGIGGLGGLGGAGVSPPASAPGALREDPQVDGLRELAAQNPALLQGMIQQLAEANPQLAQGLAQNPELLYQMFSQGAAGLEGGEEGDFPPGAQVIQVTAEERDAIARLEALGFPRQTAIEAYFACDKNEELAANYLFDRGFEDDPPQ